MKNRAFLANSLRLNLLAVLGLSACAKEALLRYDTKPKTVKTAEDTSSNIASLQGLKAFIAKNDFKDADSALKAILVKYPTLIKSRALVYRSRSIEKDDVSDAYPRVLLAEQNDKFFMAFTGKPDGKTYQRIQIIDAYGGMAEISFDPVKKASATFETNPQSCVSCHGVAHHPIFDSYNFWPGMYGSNETHTPPEGEIAKWKNFIKTSADRGRYQNIYSDKDFKSEDSPEAKANREFLQISGLVDELLQFNDHVTRMMLSKASAEITARNDFLANKFGLFAASLGCNNFEKFLPQDFDKKVGMSYAQVLADTLDKNGVYHDLRRKNYEVDGFALPNVKEDGNLFWTRFITAKVRYVAMGIGVDPSQWNFTFEPNSYVFMGGDANITEFQTPFQIPRFDYLKKLSQTIEDQGDGTSPEELALKQGCDDLLKAAQSGVDPGEPPARTVEGKSIMAESCLKCHGSNSKNKFFAGDEKWLSKQVNSKADFVDKIAAIMDPATPDKERMPRKSSPLSESDRKAIVDYLKSLKK